LVYPLYTLWYTPLYLLVYPSYAPPRILIRRPTSSCSLPLTMIVSLSIVTDFPSHTHRLDRFGNQLDLALVDTGRYSILILYPVGIANHTHYILYPSDAPLAYDEAIDKSEHLFYTLI